MNLSTYRKVQKFLLASFCISVAGFFFTGLIGFMSLNSQETNGIKPTNGVKPSPTSTTTSVNVNTSNSNPVNTTPTITANSNSNATKPEEGNYGLSIITGVTLLTSLTSLLGFISTTVLAWRKEKRDSAAIRSDNEKKELELEKLRLELEKMKVDEKVTKPKRTRKPKNSG